MSQLTLIINGAPQRVPAPASAQDLLAHLGFDAREVVVEINEGIIRQPQLGETMLNEGDRVELVHFVGGG